MSALKPWGFVVVVVHYKHWEMENGGVAFPGLQPVVHESRLPGPRAGPLLLQHGGGVGGGLHG